MKLAVRRRIAVGATTAATALVAGLLVAPTLTASAATNGLVISPSAVQNTESTTLTFKSTDADQHYGATATFVRLGAPATFTATISPDPTFPGFGKDTQNTADVDFTDGGDGLGADGPADAGSYGVTLEGAKLTPSGPGGGTDTCASCFTVLPAGPVAVTSVAPSSLRPGNNGNVSVLGNNFERSSKIDILLPGTTTVDTTVSTNNLPTSNNTDSGSETVSGVTTRTELKRRFKVAGTATPGARDVRVTDLDGRSAVCSGCFFIAGPALDSVTPSGGSNTPGTGLTAITFTGSNVTDGTPSLEFVGTPGGTSRSALNIVGTNVRNKTATSITADFDLQNAAPGSNAYQPVVRGNTGIVNACDSCRFTVVQDSSRTPTITSLDSATATAGIQKDIKQGETKTFAVSGTNFSKGAGLVLTPPDKLTVTSVEFLNTETLRATIVAAQDAAAGARDVQVKLTDAKTSNTCTGCLNVTATASPSPSSSATATASASPSPQGCPGKALTVKVNTPTINATGNASVTVTGATPTATIELQGYSQNHYGTANFDNDPTPVDRTAKADSNGSYTFNDLKPASNTRVRARQQGCTYGNSAVIEVRAQETLAVKRIGTRKYTFSGRSIPARPGGLIISLYRIVGAACGPGVEPSKCPGEKFVGQARAAALGAPNQGLYSITITFPSSDNNVRDEFVVKTGRDAQNAPGRSNARSLLIY